MKKSFYTILIIILLFTLTGCENSIVKNKINYTNGKVNVSGISYEAPQKINSNTSTISSDESSQKKVSKEVITTFSTKIYDTKQGRMNNLKIAAKQLSNKVVKSGDVFSFNENMGPYNKQNGYEKAKIFDAKGNVLEEYGGGICQISSTLYNAILNLNLEVIERNNHSKKVQYVEPGKDAAISYGNLDFKFKNTLDYDIIIQCRIENNKVIIEIEKEMHS